MLGAELLLHSLVDSGIQVCFMNPGTSEMQFVAALDRVPGMRGILGLFEGVCSGAADGYARMSAGPACTLLHLGPGLANGLANFHNARKARVPLVSVIGEHSTQHLEHDAPLSADIDLFARTVSCSVHRPRTAADLATSVSDAIVAACEPPGQIAHLIIPADFSWSEAGQPLPRVNTQIRRRCVSTDRIDKLRPLLKLGARTGVLLSGSALLDDGIAAASRLAASYGVGVYANRNAGRFDTGGDRFRPVRVPYFPEPAQALLGDLEHLILVESKAPVSFFGYPGTRSTLAPESCTIHALAGLQEDGVAALLELADGLPAAIMTTNRAAVEAIDGELTPASLGAVLASLLPDNAIVCDEMVSSSEPVLLALQHGPRHSLLPVTGGSIGQGLPVATGAAVACPSRKVVALEADGSGMYTLQSLWTMAREQLDVTTVVFANRRYRILDVEMKRTGANGFGTQAERMIDIGNPTLDWVRLSEAMGVPATRATTVAEFREQLRAALRENGPQLIEAVL